MNSKQELDKNNVRLDMKKQIIFAIFISGLLQAIIVYLQYFGVIQSFSRWFSVSGVFPNPAYAASLIAMSVGIVFVYTTKTVFSWQHLLWSGILVAFLVGAIFICGTRSCILASIVALFFLLGVAKPTKRSCFFLFCVGVTAIVLLFIIRPESCYARLLIWLVSIAIIKHNLLFGIGMGEFKYNYMLYQADFFSTHPNSSFSNVAGNVIHPFNEYIRILCEMGFVGLLLFLFAVFYLIRNSRDYSRICVIIFMVISFFLNTFDIKPLVLSFVAVIVAPYTYTILHVKYARKMLRVIGFTIAVIIICSPYVEWYRHYYGNETATKKYMYSHQIPSYNNTCEKGNLYEAAGDIEMAEYNYQLASDMIPNRIYAPYRMFKLYANMGSPKAESQARKVLQMPVGVYGDATIRMKHDVMRWLKENCNENAGCLTE